MEFWSTLLLIFIVLKCVGVLDWSWLWVLFPLWFSILWDILVLIKMSIDDYMDW